MSARRPAIVIVGAYPQSLMGLRGDLIRDLVRAGASVTAMTADGGPELAHEVRVAGAEFEPYSVERSGLSPLQDLRTLLALRSAFRRLQPSTVLCYTIKPVVYGALALLSWNRQVRFVAVLTGLGYAGDARGERHRFLYPLTRLLYRIVLPRAQVVVFLNSDDRREFVSARIVRPTRALLVPGSGINTDRFSFQPLPPGPAVFLMIARLRRAKGVREFIAAARIVRRTHPEAVFQLLGPWESSPDRLPPDELHAAVSAGVIQYLGERIDVRDSLARCHVLVLPSYREGIPRSVLEAMATGRPIVTTRVPGCRETVDDEVNGRLVAAGSSDELATALLWMLGKRSDWASMGQASRRLAIERFHVGKVNRLLLDAIGIEA